MHSTLSSNFERQFKAKQKRGSDRHLPWRMPHEMRTCLVLRHTLILFKINEVLHFTARILICTIPGISQSTYLVEIQTF